MPCLSLAPVDLQHALQHLVQALRGQRHPGRSPWQQRVMPAQPEPVGNTPSCRAHPWLCLHRATAASHLQPQGHGRFLQQLPCAWQLICAPDVANVTSGAQSSAVAMLCMAAAFAGRTKHAQRGTEEPSALATWPQARWLPHDHSSAWPGGGPAPMILHMCWRPSWHRSNCAVWPSSGCCYDCSASRQHTALANCTSERAPAAGLSQIGA